MTNKSIRLEFFGRSGNYPIDDLSKGSVIVLKNKKTQQFLILNTYLLPSDQTQGMTIVVRCLSKDQENIKSLMTECFEEDSSFQIVKGFVQLSGNIIQLPMMCFMGK